MVNRIGGGTLVFGPSLAAANKWVLSFAGIPVAGMLEIDPARLFLFDIHQGQYQNKIEDIHRKKMGLSPWLTPVHAGPVMGEGQVQGSRFPIDENVRIRKKVYYLKRQLQKHEEGAHEQS